MKVEINQDGFMTIQSETPLEAYALKCFAESIKLEDYRKITFIASAPEQPK